MKLYRTEEQTAEPFLLMEGAVTVCFSKYINHAVGKREYTSLHDYRGEYRCNVDTVPFMALMKELEG